MNTRKYKTEPKALLEQGLAIAAAGDPDKAFLIRVQAVNSVLLGVPAKEAAKACGRSPASVFGWVKAADESGFGALRSYKPAGRIRRLSPEQERMAAAAVAGDPAACGLKVWDGPSLSAFVAERFGVSLGVRQCQRLFKRMGFSRIRPRPFPSKGSEDSAEREAFKKKGAR